jgi:hypothetical protein
MQSLTFFGRTIENCTNILKYCYKNVSFALHNGWNVTKTIVLVTHDREWRDPVSELRTVLLS